MGGYPPKGKKRLLLALSAAAVIAVVALAVFADRRASEKIPDTALRQRLLEEKDHKAAFSGYEPRDSFLYSNVISDLDLKEGEIRLPWGDSVLPGPSGTRSMAWRLRVTFASVLSIKTASVPEDFSIRLIKSDGSTVYLKNNSFTLPGDEIELSPGIYVLEASSISPLDFFTLRLRRSASSREEGASPRLRTLRLKLDAFAQKELERLKTLALSSSATETVKMPQGRVKADLVDGSGRTVVEARVGLSGRTRAHLSDFPSLDVKIMDGKAVLGMEGFKLYRLDTKAGVHDMVYLSVLKDMGFLVPRQELVRLSVNGVDKGLYIVMETNAPALFTNQRRGDGNIVGVDLEKMFFDYPYGASLDIKYFFKIKGPLNVKKDVRQFLSRDFASQIERHPTALYLAFASVYYSAHGLGVDDLRWYEDATANTFSPIPRDLDPGSWGLQDRSMAHMTHFGWWTNQPAYTIWPLRRLLKGGYEFDRSAEITADATSTGLTDVHFAIVSFLMDPENLELVNRYVGWLSRNEALKEQIERRIGQTLETVLAEAPENSTLSEQLASVKKDGVPFLGGMALKNQRERGPAFRVGGRTYLWNLRTARNLEKELLPSFFSPLPEWAEDGGEAMALAFLAERKAGMLLKEAGVPLPAQTYRQTGPNPEAKDAERAFDVKAASMDNGGGPLNKAVPDLVTYMGMANLAKDRVLVLFLVRNATEKAGDFKIVMRDGLEETRPAVNRTFMLKDGPEEEKSTVKQAITNRFLPRERMRLVAFEAPLGDRARFFRLGVPEAASFLLPPYMYLPARSSGSFASGGKMPRGFVERADGFHLPEDTVVLVSGDLAVPEGKALHLHGGSKLILSPGASIKVTGDFNVLGTPQKPVMFTGAGKERWGGLYVSGRQGERAHVVIKNAVFEGYGSWPKTRAGRHSLNGGIGIYDSLVRIEGLTLRNAGSEDAINLVRCEAYIKGMEVRDTRSDGIDMDFSSALIEGLKTENTGGDGLDLSTSLVKVTGSAFSGAKDKGISVGEMSRVFVSGTLFKGNDLGVANKDQSYASVTGSAFEKNRIAFAEFIKKPIFGKPAHELKDNAYSGNKEDYSWLGFFSY